VESAIWRVQEMPELSVLGHALRFKPGTWFYKPLTAKVAPVAGLRLAFADGQPLFRAHYANHILPGVGLGTTVVR
jgi:hypothetical protein